MKVTIDISIHALREEGDKEVGTGGPFKTLFLSTPSARRATRWRQHSVQRPVISIHALREEGDLGVSRPAQSGTISIHALREEGDSKNRDKISIFKQIIQHSARI